jgi:hypothetical protein
MSLQSILCLGPQLEMLGSLELADTCVTEELQPCIELSYILVAYQLVSRISSSTNNASETPSPNTANRQGHVKNDKDIKVAGEEQ